ncbi:V-type ATP synthase subunit D [Candidatus Micrarchaeota archaeon CG10_big_fil_rev_8_21_14_0_10_45_29]|nr:MAG: V-type ATP synthase subunit D [Candidatus Micrarchaeota archaeon CG10_big_fil_rev_8_21_14_0_10_45_29]
MAENPSPTRMELIRTRSRIKLAKKGHKLLKQKRDVLIMEFFKILSKAKDLRTELNTHMAKAYKSIAIAQAYHGAAEVENISMSVTNAPDVAIEVKNVMGLKISKIEVEEVKPKQLTKRGYSIVGSSAKIDEACEDFTSALSLVIKLAETENAIRKLIREIEKTKRRVNALEFVVLPRMGAQSKLIQFRLEEMERDSFVMLKTIKRKLAKNTEIKKTQANGYGRKNGNGRNGNNKNGNIESRVAA